MRKQTTLLAAASLVAMITIGCAKEVKQPTADNEVSDAVLAKIGNLGFSKNGVQRTAGGYLVEGDIILTEENLLQGAPSSPNMVIAKEEQYRTNNLVDAGKYATITVALSNSSTQHQSAFSAALNEAIARFNAQGLAIKFQRVTSNRPHITVNSYYQVSNTLGSAGFPSTKGAPYREVKMNTYWYATGTDTKNVSYIATVMAHEIGHCIGFRHTDYMNRSFSCGGSGGNEGASNVGAVHIPGTPTNADANSWMLACIGDGVNRPFNTNDKIALNYLY